LSETDRAHLMSVVFTVERALRDLLHPDKINLASLGNQVPHVHWHVIPRFIDDAHFPDTIWATRRRGVNAHAADRAALAGRLTQFLRE
ncbi:MAG TPA: HIT family protein, partial [Pseudolabrys sp.]|nr:HIT family protein [Pseudolabrys sp.]